MIKATAVSEDGRPMVLVGLSEGNIVKLRAQQFIKVNLTEMGVAEADLVIFWGATEGAMIRMLREAGVTLPAPTDWKSTDEG